MSPRGTSLAALATSPEGVGKHAAFIYGLLREPLLDTVFMAEAMGETPLTSDAMTYIAERWVIDDV